jgi:hypothetical protein
MAGFDLENDEKPANCSPVFFMSRRFPSQGKRAAAPKSQADLRTLDPLPDYAQSL